MGIHISLGILVWGYTKHGDTHITVTAAYATGPAPSRAPRFRLKVYDAILGVTVAR